MGHREVAVLLICTVVCGCASTRTPPERPLPLGKALTEIKESILNIQAAPGQRPMGVWLTDIEVVLKIDQSSSADRGLVVGLPDAALVGTKLSFGSKNEATYGNTITIQFKNPLTLSKDTVVGALVAPQQEKPEGEKKEGGSAKEGAKKGPVQQAKPGGVPDVGVGAVPYSKGFPGVTFDVNGLLEVR